MDPNETLATLRGLRAEMDAWDQADDGPDEPGEYYRIASETTGAFRDLDEWLRKGGFLPREWSAPLTGMGENAGRAARRLETAFDRALRDDEQLDRFFAQVARQDERDRLVRLLARTVVEELEGERRNVERMLSATADRMYLRGLKDFGILDGP